MKRPLLLFIFIRDRHAAEFSAFIKKPAPNRIKIVRFGAGFLRKKNFPAQMTSAESPLRICPGVITLQNSPSLGRRETPKVFVTMLG